LQCWRRLRLPLLLFPTFCGVLLFFLFRRVSLADVYIITYIFWYVNRFLKNILTFFNLFFWERWHPSNSML
jgi:hypothetical protein